MSCYYIDDEYSFATDDTPTSPEEEAVLSGVDLVFIHSRRLLEKKGSYNVNTFHSPNGVDFSMFSGDYDEPTDLRAVRRPRIGYVGALKKQLDWGLLEGVIHACPDMSFVFVGPVSPHEEAAAAVRRLRQCSNAHFLGERSASDVPAYVRHFDVGTLPYARTPYTDFIYPVKLHEYLAAGIPVIGTRVDSLQEFAGVVELADDVAGWSAALQRCIDASQTQPDAVAKRRAVAQAHDWKVITSRIADRICEHLT